MACGYVLPPPSIEPSMEDHFAALHQPYRSTSFFSHGPPAILMGRPPLPSRFDSCIHPQPQQQYNSAPPARQGKRKRGGKKQRRQQPRQDGQRSRSAGVMQTPTDVPCTAPHAPYNSNSFLMRGTGQMTPASVVRDSSQPRGYSAGYPALDGEAAELDAKLDFYATNTPAGLPFAIRADSDSDSEDEEEQEGFDEWSASPDTRDEAEAAAEARALRTLPPALQAQLADQKRRLRALEDENLDLRERLTLAQHEIEDLKASQRTIVTPVTSSEQPITYAAPPAAAAAALGS